MDDDSGWHDILVDGWGPSVLAAVCDRVDDAFATARGALVTTVLDPDTAPPVCTQHVHTAVVEAIRAETGADLEQLGSQAAWATYDQAWVELARRWRSVPGLVVIDGARAGPAAHLLRTLPFDAAVHAGGVPGAPTVAPLMVDGRVYVDVDGLFRWLATEQRASDVDRDRAHALVAVARDG
jgi:hypothetical protein